VLFAALLPACFEQIGPEDPSPIEFPTRVTVAIEYRQPPNFCAQPGSTCGDPVWFWGSWMQPGGEIVLTRTPGTFIWTGRAPNVPVNFPPTDEPYLVRVHDPLLRETPTEGGTAERLQVGGQMVTKFYDPGTPRESGLMFIDAQGVGHNAF
jgi:hypothetical protein